MLRGHPIEGDENVWIANSQFGGDIVKPRLAGMLLQEVATRDLRDRDDFPAPLGREHFRKDGEDCPVFPAKDAGKMGFEADDERNETDRYAIEGMYEIEFPERKRIEYRYPFDRRVNVVQRHEISEGNVMCGALGRVEPPIITIAWRQDIECVVHRYTVYRLNRACSTASCLNE